MASLKMHHSFAIFLSLFVILPTVFASRAQCWYPDQKSPSPDIPCDPNAAESACCGENAFCLGSGMCYVDGVISRGSCTDQAFADPACPEYCRGYNPAGGAVVINCDASRAAWVCAGQNCSTDSFTMQDANSFMFNTSDQGVIKIGPNTVLNSTLHASSNGTSSTNSTSSSNGTSSSATSSASNSTVAAKYTAGDMAGVGAGVGVPLLLALLGALFVIWRQSKRMKDINAAKSTTSTSAAPTSASDHYQSHDNKYTPVPAYSASQPPYQPSQHTPYQHSQQAPYQPRQEPALIELSQDQEMQELPTAK